MKFLFVRIKRAPLHAAVEMENIDIIKLLISHKNIDLNKKSILI